MPFLFVDYDQGAGGEYFCANLSQSEQCVPMVTTHYPSTGRTKTHDIFRQEFLRHVPKPFDVKSDPDRYDLILAHRSCHIAKSYFGSIRSMRIASPNPDSNLWKYLIHQRVTKVLLTCQPDDKYFLGELKVLIAKTNNTEFLKRVNKNMDNLTLQMLADNIEPTDENKKVYLNRLIQPEHGEPYFKYDLVIPYEDLFYNTEKVKQSIQETFGIVIKSNWLDAYREQYEAYNQSA